MPHCCVPLCNAHSGKSRNKAKDKGTRISFHRVPQDPASLNEFAKRINRQLGPNFQVSRYTCICSLHYKKEDFYEFKTGRRELKPNTLPTIFDHGLMKNRIVGSEKTHCPIDEESGSSEETQSGRSESEHSNVATDENIPAKKNVELLQCKEENSDFLNISDTERRNDGMDSANEATSCDTTVAYSGELLNCKLVEMDTNSDTESADGTIEYEMETKDPLNVSDTECGRSQDENRSGPSTTYDTQAEHTVEDLRSKVREMNTLNGYLKGQLVKEKKINTYYETQFAKFSKDLQNVHTELRQTQQMNSRIRTELIRLRLRSQKQSALKKKET